VASLTLPGTNLVRISVVMPSLNQGRYLRRALESVFGQQGPFEIDLVVIDGGSLDGSLGILAEYTERLRLVSGPDQGQVDAIQRGLAMCRGDVVGWLNSDDALLPGAFRRIAEAFQWRPDWDWVHGRCRIVNEDDREVQRWISRYKHARCLRHSFDALLLENYISQMTVYWRRGLLETIGPLDAEVPLAFDYDLWLRLAEHSDPGYIVEPQAAFRRHPESKTGRGYVEMFQQEYRVAQQHAAGRRRTLWRKRLRTMAFTLVYRALDQGRRLRPSVAHPCVGR